MERDDKEEQVVEPVDLGPRWRVGYRAGLRRARDLAVDLCRCADPGNCAHDDLARSITEEICQIR